MAERERSVDLCIGWGPWPREPFLDILERECEIRTIRLSVCDGGNVERTVRSLETGSLRVLLHIDMQADYEDSTDIFARLGYAVRDSGGYVANEPDAARAAQNKAILHYQFERNGIPVPRTVVVRNWEPSGFRLTSSERTMIGRPFVMKPARGFGKTGVVTVRRGTPEEIASARGYDRGDDFLIQECVEPAWFGYKRGWFRTFYIFGFITACWWDPATQHYSIVSLKEANEFGLHRLYDIAGKIAFVSGMDFFSTEIAVSGYDRHRRFLAIDYVNDPCDLTPASHSHSGVPDVLVRNIAVLLCEAASRIRYGRDLWQEKCVWFGGEAL